MLWLDSKYFSESYWWDRSKYRNNGVVHGAKWKDNSFYFDGDDDYIELLNNPSLNITDKVTIAAWAKSYINEQANCIIVGTQSPDKTTDRHYFGYDADGNLGIGVGNQAWNNESNGYKLDTDWHFYTLVTDGSTHKIYVDANYKGEKTGVQKPETNPWYIGCNHCGTGASAYFYGYIPFVYICHDALTSEEIGILYNLTYRR